MNMLNILSIIGSGEGLNKIDEGVGFQVNRITIDVGKYISNNIINIALNIG